MRIVIVIIFSLASASIVLAQDSADGDFNLDEFSEGLEVKESNLKVPAKKDLKKTIVEEAPEDKEYEKIEVTGSHVKRLDMEGASPVMMIDRDMIEQSGHNSVSDVLRDLTASSFGGARESSGSSAAGVASVNLRGLGADKTLVLLNGKRLPVDAVTGSVDLNLIPLAAVKRVDVLTDGASATYGSDALGGVVNIITYKDINNSRLNYQQSFITQYDGRGGHSKQADFVTGSATSRSFVTTILSYRENDKILSRDRPWSDNGVSTIGNPVSFIDDSGTWRANDSCDPSDVIDGGGGNEFCSFRFSDFSTELPQLRQLNLMSLFEYELDNGVTVYGRVSATQKEIKWNFAPAPGLFQISESVASELGIPGYAGGDVTVRYRATELGNRNTEVDTFNLGYQAGVKGSVTGAWDWDLTFDRNTVYKNDLGVSGYGLTSKIEEFIADGSFNPFDPASSTADIGTASYQPWQLSRSENNFTELKFTGELLETKNGAVGAAVGVAHTLEKFSTSVDELSERGEVFGSAGSSGGGERETKAFYIETVSPLGKSVELQIAGRYDEFSDFGSTTNPKLGLVWKITPELLFRTSAGTGFKAPLLRDLYAAQSDGFPTFIDEVACAAEKQGGGSTPSCNPQQWRVISGGNEGLEEERSESYNMGLVFQPTRRSSYGFDVWLTKLDNVVDIDYQLLTQYERDNGTAALSDLGIEVSRDASGQIEFINAPLLNLASLEISGIDLNTRFGLTNNFSLAINHSQLFYYRQEGFPDTGFEDFLGRNGLPAWRNNVTLDYTRGKASLRLIAKTIGEHEKSVRGEGDLPAYTESDLNFSYRFNQSRSATVGMTNVFLGTPPLDETNPNQQLRTQLYNPRGQSVFFGLNERF